MAETKETIKEQFKKLPQDIKDAILAADLPDKFKTIANKHKLRIDQSSVLENETMFVMLGLEHSDDYTNNLKKEAGIPDEEAGKIAEEVSRTIFLPIRASLQKLHEEEKESSLASDDMKAVADKGVRGIEHPPLGKEETTETSQEVSAPEKDIFREKLEKQTRSAKEEVLLREPSDDTQNKQQTAAPQQTKQDPYREPIEKKDTEGIKQEGLKTNNGQPTPKESKLETGQATNNEKTTTTPSQPQTEAKKPVTTPTPPTAEKLSTETPPQIIPPPISSPTSAPATSAIKKPISQSMEQKKEVPLPKTGIINMPGNKTENVVPRADQPLAEKKVSVPQKPSVEINKVPSFVKEKISTDKQSVSSELKDIVIQKTESADNAPQNTLHILEKTSVPIEKTAIKNPPATPASSPPPVNLPQKEIETQKQTPVPSTNEKKKDPTTDPYREPID